MVNTSKNNPKIILVGAGNLGSRYLQGLLKIKKNIEIDIIEPSEISIDNCKSLIKNVNKKNKKINFFKCFQNQKIYYDLAIISTTANIRQLVVKDLLDKNIVKFWILEKVLAQSINDLNKLAGSFDNQKYVWVNNCFRVMEWHSRIKDEIFTRNQKSIKVILNGRGWGMACNAIHYIDLIAWWTNSEILNIDTSKVNYWERSKRKGFYECFGKIKISYNKGNSLELNCDFGKSDLLMKISTPNGLMDFNENKGIAKGPDNIFIKGNLEYQSDITCPIVEKILECGKCDLNGFKESYIQHKLLVDLIMFKKCTINFFDIFIHYLIDFKN